MVASEAGRAEVLGSARGAQSEKRKSVNLGIPADLNGSAIRERERLSMVYGVQGSPDTTEPPSELVGLREKAVVRPTPRADRRTRLD